MLSLGEMKSFNYFRKANLGQTRIQCEACPAKTKLFIVLRVNMAAVWDLRSIWFTPKTSRLWISEVDCVEKSVGMLAGDGVITGHIYTPPTEGFSFVSTLSTQEIPVYLYTLLLKFWLFKSLPVSQLNLLVTEVVDFFNAIYLPLYIYLSLTVVTLISARLD